MWLETTKKKIKEKKNSFLFFSLMKKERVWSAKWYIFK
jgi:hypothetical protein